MKYRLALRCFTHCFQRREAGVYNMRYGIMKGIARLVRFTYCIGKSPSAEWDVILGF